MTNVEVFTFVVPRWQMTPWDSQSGKDTLGELLDIPDPLPDAWRETSARHLQEAQDTAKRWRDSLLRDVLFDDGVSITLPVLPGPSPTTDPTTEPTSATASQPSPRSKAQLSRVWVLNSGSAHHIQDKAELTSGESEQIQAGDDHILETANGDRTVNEHINIQLPPIGFQSSALALDDCPSVLSVGQLVQNDGFRQIWDQQLGYLLQDPQGQW